MTRKVLYSLLVGRTKNLGDDIQTLAAAQFLPRIDFVIDRDNPRLPVNLKKKLGSGIFVKVIMNGWFTLNPLSWMPDPLIKPLFLSFHIHPPISRVFLGRKSVVEYLKCKEPIGARDFCTCKILDKYGIASFFSGCLSLVLNYKYGKLFNANKVIDYDYILMSDLDENIVNSIKNVFVNKKVLHVSQDLFTSSSDMLLPKNVKKVVRKILGEDVYSLANIIVYNILDKRKAQEISVWSRLKLAEEYLATIAHSQLVITSRLHTALPALSFGVPVIFINNNLKDPRFSGYLQFLHAFTPIEFINTIKNREFKLSRFLDIPNRETLKEIKKKLIDTVGKFI